MIFRDKAIEPVPTRYECAGGRGRDIYQAGWGGKAYMKLKRYERGVFDSFSRRGSALYEADRRGGEQYFEPKNDVPYRICSVSIARSLRSHFLARQLILQLKIF